MTDIATGRTYYESRADLTAGEVIRALEVSDVTLEYCRVDWFITIPVPSGRSLMVKNTIWRSTAEPPIEIAPNARPFLIANLLEGTWGKWMLEHASLIHTLNWSANHATGEHKDA